MSDLRIDAITGLEIFGGWPILSPGSAIALLTIEIVDRRQRSSAFFHDNPGILRDVAHLLRDGLAPFRVVHHTSEGFLVGISGPLDAAGAMSLGWRIRDIVAAPSDGTSQRLEAFVGISLRRIAGDDLDVLIEADKAWYEAQYHGNYGGGDPVVVYPGTWHARQM